MVTSELEVAVAIGANAAREPSVLTAELPGLSPFRTAAGRGQPRDAAGAAERRRARASGTVLPPGVH